MDEIERPFPIPITLPENNLLLDFGLASREARFQIKRQADRVTGRVEHHVAVLERNTVEIETRAIHRWLLADIPETLGGKIQIHREAIVIRHPVFQFLTQL